MDTYNLKDIVSDPGRYFDSPMELIKSEDYNHKEKRHILEAWKSHRKKLREKEIFNLKPAMFPNPDVRLSEINAALLNINS